MGTFSVLLALCEGNPPVTSGFPSQRAIMQNSDAMMLKGHQSNVTMINVPQQNQEHHSWHYDDVRMGAIASQITNLTIVNSTVNSDADQRNIKDPRHWPLCGEFTGTGEFPAQRASYAENVFIWWRHHVEYTPYIARQKQGYNSWNIFHISWQYYGLTWHAIAWKMLLWQPGSFRYQKAKCCMIKGSNLGCNLELNTRMNQDISWEINLINP